MKNKLKFCFASLVSILSISSLVSCFDTNSIVGPDVSGYVDNLAIKKLRDGNVSTNKLTYDLNSEIFGDYVRDRNGYTSIISGKQINSTMLQAKSINGFGSLYYINVGNEFTFYDAYGNKGFSLTRNEFNSLTFNTCYYFASEDSKFYKEFYPNNEETKTPRKLHTFKCGYFKTRGYSDINFDTVLIKEENSSQKYSFLETNKNYENLDFSDFIPSDFDRIEHIGDGEIRLHYGDTIKSITYFKDNNTLNNVQIRFEYEQDTQDTGDILLFSVPFQGGNTSFEYYVKQVDGITNDFTFVYLGKMYKARISYGAGSAAKINFVPLSYIFNEDKSKALVLCKKIDEDGNLLNKFHSVELSFDGSFSGFSEDISPFQNERNYKFNNQMFQLQDDEELLVLNDNLLISSNKKSKNYFLKDSNGYNDYFYEREARYDAISNFSINGTYFLFLKFGNGMTQVKAISRNNAQNVISQNYADFISINLNEGVYVVDNALYVGNDCITGTYNSNSSYNRITYNDKDTSHIIYLFQTEQELIRVELEESNL